MISRSRLRAATAWLLVFLCTCTDITAQALPPPRDGEIRVLYWELRNETEVWLTLEPRSPDGKAGPGILTLTLRFPGKHPKMSPVHVDMRTYAGYLWAPQVTFWLVLDDREKLDLVPPGLVVLSTGSVSDYLHALIGIPTLRRIANAKRVTGNALGFTFELTESQRKAVRAFLERVLSDNPAQFSR